MTLDPDVAHDSAGAPAPILRALDAPREPLFAEPLHVGCPNVPDRERLLARVNDLLDRRWFTNHGPYAQELEQRIAEFAGVRHCIAVCNGTIGLEIAIRASGLTGEVIVPSFTFVATAHALQWQEITPVFCDVDPETWNVDPRRVEERITSRTTGVIGVHLWGRGCDVEALTNIAARHNLTLLFDAAHAFGCSHEGRMIGSFGRAEVYSFHATKVFNTFEGGAIVTDDDELAAKIRLMTNFGFAGHDNVVCIGTNGKMNEVSAAMGLGLLEDLDDFVAANYMNYKAYEGGLRDLPGLRLVTYDENERCNYHYVVLEIDADVAGLTRDELLDALWRENVHARRYFYPGCHKMEPYRSRFPHARLVLPVTETLGSRVLALPSGSALTPEDVGKVCALIRATLDAQAGSAATRRLARPGRELASI